MVETLFFCGRMGRCVHSMVLGLLDESHDIRSLRFLRIEEFNICCVLGILLMDVADFSTSDYLTTRSAIVGTFALYVYEYLLTFGDELRLVWHSRMSMVKTLFLINRYLPFSPIIIASYTYTLITDDSLCRRLFTTITILSATGVIIAEIVLALRVYIIWERSRRILFCLSTLILAGIVGGYYGTVRYIRGASISKIDALVDGCVVRTGDRMSEAISYGLIMVYETFVLILMLIKMIRYRTTSSALMRVAYGDSVFYCTFILVVTISNVVLLAVESDILCHLLLLPQAALHNILCNRLLLRLRNANTSLSEEGFLSIHILVQPSRPGSQRFDSLDNIPLNELGVDIRTETNTRTKDSSRS